MKNYIRLSILTLATLLLFSGSLFADKGLTLSGTIKDAKSGENLIGVSVYVTGPSVYGAYTNEYGYYSIQLPKGTYNVKVSYLGYTPINEQITISSSVVKNWNIESNNKLNEVVISSTRLDDNLTKPEIGLEKINITEIAKLPVLFGEKDVLKTIQLLPGVKSQGEGTSGFSVRGGSTDQNLILLDEATVYNASHLLGFFSTFNSDAVKDATLIKGNSAAQYGGRTASVLDIKMKEGNNQTFHAIGGIGLISSRLTVEGPILKNRASFMVSGRRTYADLFLKLTDKFKDNVLYFYDVNAKLNFQINDKHRIYLSAYTGKDVLGLSGAFGLDWGNQTATARWNYIISGKWFSNTSLIYSQYNNRTTISGGETEFKIESDIQDVSLKQDFSYFLNEKNTIKFGFQSSRFSLSPRTFTGTVTFAGDDSFSKKGWENAIYFNNVTVPNDFLNISYGLRVSSYTMLGQGTYNVYQNGEMSETIILDKGQLGRSYFSIEPRFTLNYRIDKMQSLKFGLARNSQNLHLLSNVTGGSPTDQWIGNTYNIKPEFANQVSLGYTRNFKQDQYEVTVETYYKFMENQIDYKDYADLQNALDLEEQLLFGIGRSYGVELIIKKKTGKLTGWIGYTLSKTERKIDGINEGNWYNARQDRPHDLTVVMTYQFNTKWSISGLFVYNTGNAVTFPIGKYNLNGQTIYQYSARNADRLPDYHRLDISVNYDFKKRGSYESSLNFGLYNVYGRENAYTITFRDNPDDPTKTEAVQNSLFRWVPSISYNFKF